MDEEAEAKRLEALEKANKHMHDQQDHVKAFHAKMLVADVLQEREQQKVLQK